MLNLGESLSGNFPMEDTEEGTSNIYYPQLQDVTFGQTSQAAHNSKPARTITFTAIDTGEQKTLRVLEESLRKCAYFDSLLSGNWSKVDVNRVKLPTGAWMGFLDLLFDFLDSDDDRQRIFVEVACKGDLRHCLDVQHCALFFCMPHSFFQVFFLRVGSKFREGTDNLRFPRTFFSLPEPHFIRWLAELSLSDTVRCQLIWQFCHRSFQHARRVKALYEMEAKLVRARHRKDLFSQPPSPTGVGLSRASGSRYDSSDPSNLPLPLATREHDSRRTIRKQQRKERRQQRQTRHTTEGRDANNSSGLSARHCGTVMILKRRTQRSALARLLADKLGDLRARGEAFGIERGGGRRPAGLTGLSSPSPGWTRERARKVKAKMASRVCHLLSAQESFRKFLREFRAIRKALEGGGHADPGMQDLSRWSPEDEIAFPDLAEIRRIAETERLEAARQAVRDAAARFERRQRSAMKYMEEWLELEKMVARHRSMRGSRLFRERVPSHVTGTGWGQEDPQNRGTAGGLSGSSGGVSREASGQAGTQPSQLEGEESGGGGLTDAREVEEREREREDEPSVEDDSSNDEPMEEAARRSVAAGDLVGEEEVRSVPSSSSSSSSSSASRAPSVVPLPEASPPPAPTVQPAQQSSIWSGLTGLTRMTTRLFNPPPPSVAADPPRRPPTPLNPFTITRRGETGDQRSESGVPNPLRGLDGLHPAAPRIPGVPRTSNPLSLPPHFGMFVPRAKPDCEVCMEEWERESAPPSPMSSSSSSEEESSSESSSFPSESRQMSETLSDSHPSEVPEKDSLLGDSSEDDSVLLERERELTTRHSMKSGSSFERMGMRAREREKRKEMKGLRALRKHDEVKRERKKKKAPKITPQADRDVQRQPPRLVSVLGEEFDADLFEPPPSAQRDLSLTTPTADRWAEDEVGAAPGQEEIPLPPPAQQGATPPPAGAAAAPQEQQQQGEGATATGGAAAATASSSSTPEPPPGRFAGGYVSDWSSTASDSDLSSIDLDDGLDPLLAASEKESEENEKQEEEEEEDGFICELLGGTFTSRPLVPPPFPQFSHTGRLSSSGTSATEKGCRNQRKSTSSSASRQPTPHCPVEKQRPRNVLPSRFLMLANAANAAAANQSVSGGGTDSSSAAAGRQVSEGDTEMGCAAAASASPSAPSARTNFAPIVGRLGTGSGANTGGVSGACALTRPGGTSGGSWVEDSQRPVRVLGPAMLPGAPVKGPSFGSPPRHQRASAGGRPGRSTSPCPPLTVGGQTIEKEAHGGSEAIGKASESDASGWEFEDNEDLSMDDDEEESVSGGKKSSWWGKGKKGKESSHTREGEGVDEGALNAALMTAPPGGTGGRESNAAVPAAPVGSVSAGAAPSASSAAAASAFSASVHHPSRAGESGTTPSSGTSSSSSPSPSPALGESRARDSKQPIRSSVRDKSKESPEKRPRTHAAPILNLGDRLLSAPLDVAEANRAVQRARKETEERERKAAQDRMRREAFGLPLAPRRPPMQDLFAAEEDNEDVLMFDGAMPPRHAEEVRGGAEGARRSTRFTLFGAGRPPPAPQRPAAAASAAPGGPPNPPPALPEAHSRTGFDLTARLSSTVSRAPPVPTAPVPPPFQHRAGGASSSASAATAAATTVGAPAEGSPPPAGTSETRKTSVSASLSGGFLNLGCRRRWNPSTTSPTRTTAAQPKAAAAALQQGPVSPSPAADPASAGARAVAGQPPRASLLPPGGGAEGTAAGFRVPRWGEEERGPGGFEEEEDDLLPLMSDPFLHPSYRDRRDQWEEQFLNRGGRRSDWALRIRGPDSYDYDDDDEDGEDSMDEPLEPLPPPPRRGGGPVGLSSSPAASGAQSDLTARGAAAATGAGGSGPRGGLSTAAPRSRASDRTGGAGRMVAPPRRSARLQPDFLSESSSSSDVDMLGRGGSRMNPYSGDRLRGAEAAARALAMSKKEKEKGEDTDVVPRRPGRGQPEQSGRTEPQPADAAPSAAAAASSSSSARPGASRPSPAERPWASLAADRAPAMAVNSRASTKPKPTMGFFDSDPLVLRPRERRLSPQQELIDMGEGDEPMGPVGFPGMENVTTVLLRRPGRFLFEPINPEGRPAEGGAHMTAENRLQRSLVIRLWSLQLGAPLRLPRRDELLSISREIVESRLAHAQGLVRSRNDSLRLLGAGEHHPPLHFRRDLGTPGALFGGGNPPADPSIFVPPTRLADPRAEERARETADPATGKGENRRLVEFYDDLKRLYGASPGEAVEWDEESEEGVRRLFSDHLLPFFFAAVGIPPALSLHVLNRRQRNGGDQQQQGGDEETDDPREIPIPPLPSEWVPVGEWMHLRRGEIVRMVRHILQAVVHVGDFTTRQQNQRHQPSPAPRVTVRIGRHSTVVQESASAAASASSSSSHPSSSPPASAGSSSSPSPVPPPAAASRGSQLDPNAPPFVPSARPPAVTHRPPPPAYSAFAAPLPPTASAPKHHVPLSRPVTRSSYRLSGRTMAAPPPPGASAFASLSSASLIAHPHSHGGNPTPSPRNAWLHFILAWLNNSLTLDHLNRASGLLRSEGRALRAALISGRDARRVQEEWQETEDALERREWEDVVSLGGRVHLPSGGHNEGVLGISGSGAITPPYPRGGAGAETPSSSVSPASSSSTAHQPPQKQQRTVERERSESETEGQRDDIPMQEGDRDRLLAAPAASATVERFRPLVSAMSLPTAPTQGEEEEGGDPMDDAEMEDVEEEGAGEGVGSGTQRVKRKREVRVPGAKGAPPVQAEGAASAAASSSSSASASTHSFFATRSTTAGSSVSASVPLSLAGAAAATAAAAGVPLTTSKSKSGQEKGAAASSSSSSNPQSLSKAGSKGRKK